MKAHPALSAEKDCNAYLVRLKDGPVLVDCGTPVGSAAIKANIRKAGFDPGGITDLMLTHSHDDHAGAAFAWQRDYGIRIHLGETGAEHLERGDKRLLGGEYDSFEVDHRVRDNEEFQVAGSVVRATSAPGHTPDCVLYTCELDGRFVGFSGDVCFAPADWDPMPGIVGTLGAPWKSNLTDYRESLKRMLRIEMDVLLPGHGFIVTGKEAVHKTVAAALATIEGFLATPKIYAFYLGEL
jgi:glyoxylase-like metal-dependent hydrolase (beta-lactamase superfamily II)